MTSANERFDEQRRRNLASRGQWEAFAAHRNRVTALLLEAAQGRDQPSLCLLGAGNCNDIDLGRLLSAYGTIHLVDCDLAALSAGVQRQKLAGHPAIVLHGDVDLLGLKTAQPGAEPEELVAASVKHQPLQGLGRVDVAVSLCLLSQLIEAAAGMVAGEEDGPRLEIIQAIRRHHLQLLVEVLRPGGSGLFVTDLVSSETAPQLQTLPESQLAALVATCISRRNFFTGLNPAVILDLLQHDPWFAARVVTQAPAGPWKWDLGPRSYAVYAISFTRRRES